MYFTFSVLLRSAAWVSVSHMWFSNLLWHADKLVCSTIACIALFCCQPHCIKIIIYLHFLWRNISAQLYCFIVMLIAVLPLFAETYWYNCSPRWSLVYTSLPFHFLFGNWHVLSVFSNFIVCALTQHVSKIHSWNICY